MSKLTRLLFVEPYQFGLINKKSEFSFPPAVPVAQNSLSVTRNIPEKTCSASVKTLGFYKTLRSYLCALPQARLNQSDVSVTPSYHNVLDVGGGPKRCNRIAIVVHEHEKPFVVDRMAETLREVI